MVQEPLYVVFGVRFTSILLSLLRTIPGGPSATLLWHCHACNRESVTMVTLQLFHHLSILWSIFPFYETCLSNELLKSDPVVTKRLLRGLLGPNPIVTKLLLCGLLGPDPIVTKRLFNWVANA